MTALASDRYFWQKGWQFWRDEPGSALKLAARKTWLLVAANERSNNKNLAFWRERSNFLRWPLWLSWAPILGLAVLGLARTDLARPQRLLMMGILGFYAAALLLFFINGRFRLPLLAWLVVPGGAGLALLWQAARTTNWKAMPRIPLLCAALAVAISVVPDALTYHQEPATDFQSWQSLGNSYLSIGDQRRAIESYEKTLAIDHIDPQPANRWSLQQIYISLASLYQKDQRPQRVLDLYRRWVKRLPDSTPARMGLANILLQNNKPAPAAEHLAAVLEVDPENSDAHLGYGWALHGCGRDSSAIHHFLLAAKDADNPSAQYGIGLCQIDLALLPEAEITLTRLLNRWPDFSPALEDLARLYHQTGQAEKERRLWRRVLQKQPGHRQAQERLAQLG